MKKSLNRPLPMIWVLPVLVLVIVVAALEPEHQLRRQLIGDGREAPAVARIALIRELEEQVALNLFGYFFSNEYSSRN